MKGKIGLVSLSVILSIFNSQASFAKAENSYEPVANLTSKKI